MRYVQLRAFHHVAIHGGFSRSADALHLTQPAISDQVRKLESEYDVRLFNRSKKQITVTQAGEQLLKITRRMFEIEGQAHEFLSESRAVRTGTLNIMSDSTHHLLHILARFREKHPGIFVSVRAGNSAKVLNSLDAYDADIGVLGEVPHTREYETMLLSSTPIVAFVSKHSELAKHKSITFHELLKLPLVLREPGSRTRAELEQQAKVHRIKLTGLIEAEGREAVRDIVAGGGGVGIVSLAEFGRDPDLVKIQITKPEMIMDEALVCLRERKDSKLIRVFMALAREKAHS
jgi:aminoethylphosphonate catabolism LysR family transcriptional regulator